MSIKINVQITEKDIFKFQLYHNYTHMSGIIGLLVGLALIILGIVDIATGNIPASFIWFVCGLMIWFFPLSTMRSKAKRQVKNSDMFQHPLEYEFAENGVTTRQGELEVTNEWSAIERVVSTKQYVMFYMSRVRAIIFPKRCMGDQYDAIVEMIRAHIPEEQVKIK